MSGLLPQIRILLGVTGSIAAYKACEVLRLLQREGAEVRVMMTASAQWFVTPLTFETLSGNEVMTDLFPRHRVVKTEHVHVSEWAQCVLICPATFNCIGKVASGIADDFVTTVISASRAPVIFAPAMDFQMADNPIFVRQCEYLKSLGYRFVPFEEGHLASGLEGKGRLASPQRILDAVRLAVFGKNTLQDHQILVTAGPTREFLDPVRYLTNRSSGKMGYAIAEQAFLRGAKVTLITGPTSLRVMDGIRVIPVTSAHEMAEAVFREWPQHDALFMTAAVADFTPKTISSQKIKKTNGPLTLELQNTVDILQKAGESKGKRVVIGFTVETENGVERALQKLKEKHLDWICLNNPTEPGAGFEVDTNKITVIDKKGQIMEWPLLSKYEIAGRLLDLIFSGRAHGE